MWDTVQDIQPRLHLSRELPCQRCGHAAHRYLACDTVCDCQPVALPGILAS